MANLVRSDLAERGYQNPVICPVSAYFAGLIKQRMRGIELDDEEADDFARLSKKFRRPEFDLSPFYSFGQPQPGEDELTELSKRCGIFQLESILLQKA